MVIFEFPTLKIVYKNKWTFAKIFFINFIGFSSYVFFITYYLRFYLQKTSFKKKNLNKKDLLRHFLSILFKTFLFQALFSLGKCK